MQHRQVGDRVPAVTFRTRSATDWENVHSDDLFKGQRAVLFSLPGAFTPTCSAAQLPGYNQLAPLFRANGIDRIVCLSVNDAFVMRQWQDTQQIDNVTLIPDGNGEFTEAMGFLVDRQELGFGKRSWRYAMVVNDGVIEALFVEPEQPGDPYEVSDPLTVLRYLDPALEEPNRFAVFIRPGCAHCARAIAVLEAQQQIFSTIEVPDAEGLYAATGQRTTPQVYCNGQRLGGADDLEAYFAAPVQAANAG